MVWSLFKLIREISTTATLINHYNYLVAKKTCILVLQEMKQKSVQSIIQARQRDGSFRTRRLSIVVQTEVNQLIQHLVRSRLRASYNATSFRQTTFDSQSDLFYHTPAQLRILQKHQTDDQHCKSLLKVQTLLKS